MIKLCCVALLTLTGCGMIKNLKKEKSNSSDGGAAYYIPKSLDECITDTKHCLKGENVTLQSPNIKLARFLRTSEIFVPLTLESIDLRSRKTFEGAAIANTAKTLNEINNSVMKDLESTPEVYVDPYCNHPQGSHNSFYRSNFGTDEVLLRHSICLGISYESKLGPIPLSFDNSIIAHEYFHVLFSEFFNENNDLLNVSYENHDLESLNEGLADYFAYSLFGEYSQWFSDKNNLYWRNHKARQNLVGNKEFYSHIYKDGQRWTQFASVLAENELNVLESVKCTLTDLKTKTLAALKSKTWNEVVTTKDILESFKTCLPENDEAFLVALKQSFPDDIASGLLENVELQVVGFTNAKALCEFSKLNKLKPSQLKKYEYINGCENVTSLSFKGNSIGFAKELMSKNPSLEKELVYVMAGAKVDGAGRDCRLRGETGHLSEVLLSSDIGIEKYPFINLVPANKRGSSYRDIPFGNFDDETMFTMGGGFESLESQGFRFISYDATNGLETGVSGYTFLPAFLVDEESKENQNQEVANRLKGVFGSYYRTENNDRCKPENEGCFKYQNFYMECTSHLKEKSETGLYEPVFIETKSVAVSIFDCWEDGKCYLKSY